jgi:two-component sensor histidine kinase
MATLGELTRQHTSLTRDEIDHLQRLIGEWGLLADLSFADLLLYVPDTDGKWIVVAHVRPATGQTIYAMDYVGTAAEVELPLLDKSYGSGEICEGEIEVESVPEPVRMMATPVRCDDKVIAVLSREWASRSSRQPGELERTYISLFQRFTSMIAEGSFPFSGPVADSSAAPRVGDGVLVLDEEARVRFASPNAVSALHRVGIGANAVGLRLAELGFNDSPVRRAFETKLPVVEEFDQTSDVTLLARCMPVLAGGGVTGGVLLLRDVTEVRKRDRLLLSKDATIREIHHRVKNNLQTISSLLRLQGRRLNSEEAKAAVAESVRRIRTIALVHETLSREPGDDVAFLEIVRPLLRLAEEGLQSPDRPVRFTVQGDGGRLPSTVATPLSVVLTELLQNAVDHGFPEGSSGGDVVVVLDNT